MVDILVEVGAGVNVPQVAVHRCDIDNCDQDQHIGSLLFTNGDGDLGHFCVGRNDICLLVGTHKENLRRRDSLRNEGRSAQSLGCARVAVVLELDQCDARIEMKGEDVRDDVGRGKNGGFGSKCSHCLSPS
jgi:hypothetical protein